MLKGSIIGTSTLEHIKMVLIVDRALSLVCSNMTLSPIYPNLTKKNQKMSTCNQLDLETLGYGLLMPKTSPDTDNFKNKIKNKK